MVIDFTTPTPLRRFELVAEGRTLYVNAHYLAEISPYFHALCFANFRENQDNRVHLNGVQFEDMHELLRCVCPDENFEFERRISADNFAALVYLSSRLLLQNLRRDLESLIQRNPSPILDSDAVSTATLTEVLGEVVTAAYSEASVSQMCRRLGKRSREEVFAVAEQIFPKDFAAKLQERLQSYYYQQPLIPLKYVPQNWNDGVYMRLFF